MVLKPVTRLRFIIGMIFFLPLLGIILALQMNAIENYLVTSASMEPTLLIGDRVIVRRIARYFPQRGEIIAFENPLVPGELVTKRVIGMPGDKIEIWRGILYVNGEEQTELFLSQQNARIHIRDMRANIPTDSVFVLGDNRNFSFDSLNFGPVSSDNIRGRLTMIYWPPDRWRRVQ